VAGLATVFGSGAMTNSIADIEKADVILVTGSNTTENHPVLAAGVKRAVKHKNAKLIVVDPRRIELTKFASIWLRPQLGSDVAWINGLMHVIIKEDLYDHDFVNNRTANFEELQKTVDKYTPEYVQEITGIPAEHIRETARLYASAKAGSILYTMGITQHISGTDNVKSLANLAMLCGNIGIEGGGVNPLRGQNNVQGACDLGGLPNVYSAYQKVTDPAIRQKMAKYWNVESLPENAGLQLTEMISQAQEGRIKSLYIIGENPGISDPDSQHVKKALQNLDFLVVQDIFMTETAQMADVVLPSACFAEKDGTFTNTERRVQRVRQAIHPPGEAKTDLEIIQALSQKMGHPMTYGSAEEVMHEISMVTPSYAGITYERIADEGIHWPCSDTGHPGTPILHCEQFTCGLGQFQAIEYIPPAEIPDEEYPFWLTTGRVLYHYHTGTMTRKVQGLNSLAPESFVEIAPQDAAQLNLEEKSNIEVTSRRGTIQSQIKISPLAVPGTVFIPFHFAESAANVLTNTATDPIAGIPEFKVCSVKLTKKS
jgi:formate dehydrogenase alpha subunit